MSQMTLINIPSHYCRVCGRELTDPESVRIGVGPICRAQNGDEIAHNTEKCADHYINEPINPNGVILRRDESGVWTNVPHIVVQHSPTGYEWGYGGSGPADLALNICECVLHQIGFVGVRQNCYDGSCFMFAYDLHQSFKWYWLNQMPREGGRIEYDDITSWIKEKLDALARDMS